MATTIINSIDDFIALHGKLLGESEWVDITQNIINDFADATMDHQWIHVDTQKAVLESPYHKTIAHGYLTLSLLPHLLGQIVHVNNLQRIVNYGIEKMVFKNAVPVDSRIRLRATLKAAKDLGDICLANIQCSFEVEGQKEPVLEGNIKYLYYFNNKTN